MDISIEEISPEELREFWDAHIKYLVDDGIVTDEEDIEYFKGDEYRGILEEYMRRETDRHHMVWFVRNGKRIGAASYCTYASEDGKCFIMDFWVFPEARGDGTGHGSGSLSVSSRTERTSTGCLCTYGKRRMSRPTWKRR